MKTLLVTIALAIATPAFAWDDPGIVLQTYEVDQRLNDLARQATQSNQAAVNRGLVLINPTQHYVCDSYSHGIGVC